MMGTRLIWAAAGCAAILGAFFGYTAIESVRISREWPPTGAFTAIEGGRLHYTERQPAGLPRATILLIHGASGNQADLMIPLGDRLAAAGFRVIAVDRPGHGWSDRPDGEGDASPARQAVLIREGLEHIGIHHAIVLGHSWAGALAANFAIDQADFTDGLVLLSPVTHPWSTGIAWYIGPTASAWVGPVFTHLVTMPVGLGLLDAGVAEVFAPQSVPEAFVQKTGLKLVLRPAEFTANAQDVLHLLDFVTQQAPRLKTIRVPTAIVAGDEDHVVATRIHAVASARDIPDATLLQLPGVGHSPHWARPAEVVQVIVALADRMQAQQRSAAVPSIQP